MKWIALLIVVFLVVSCGQRQVQPAPTIPSSSAPGQLEAQIATLQDVTGEVVLNGQSVSSGSPVRGQDTVSTKDGEATIAFEDGSELRLDQQTTIMITKESNEMTIMQSAGQTWTRLMAIAGIETYKVQTPTSVATVRGTGFAVNVSDDGAEIIVDDGEVEVVSLDEQGKMQERQVLFDQERAQIKKKAKKMAIKAMDPKERKAMRWMIKNSQRDDVMMEKMAERMMGKAAVKGAKGKTKMDALKGYMRGKVSKEDLVKQGVMDQKKAKDLPEKKKRMASKMISKVQGQSDDLDILDEDLSAELKDLDAMLADIEAISSLP